MYLASAKHSGDIKRVRAKYTKAGYDVSTKTDLYRVAKKRGLIT